jgi:murein DD-endopeptidase MepM/ murein hydrolase activator NlpD
MRSIRAALPAALTTAFLIASFVGAVPAASAAAPPTAVVAEPTPPVATRFATPLATKTYTVSSFYGARCMPLPGASTFHEGLDMAAPTGAPIAAVAAGIVVATVDGTSARAGYVKLRHSIDGVTYTSIYYHIWKSTTRVKVGQLVAAGQRISEVGSSGVSSGSHLHLEIWKGTPGSATSLDPAPFFTSRGVDLLSGARSVTATRPPATCTYYTTTGVNFRTGPSTSAGIIRVLPIGTATVQVPGRSTNGYLPVTVAGRPGWISSAYVSPTRPAVPRPAPVATPVPAAKPAPAKPAPAKPAPAAVKPKPAAPATYRTAAALNFRRTPSMSGAKILVIPKGSTVGSIRASKGVWRQISYKGKTGWVHSAYLAKR